MYIGSTGPRGLHHLVYEIVDNSIDEALAGYCTKIDVVIEKGDIIRVTDNGREKRQKTVIFPFFYVRVSFFFVNFAADITIIICP